MIKECLGMATLVGLLLLAGQWDYEDEINAEKYYTESVCLWYATGGTRTSEGSAGHPDYKGLGIKCTD